MAAKLEQLSLNAEPFTSFLSLEGAVKGQVKQGIKEVKRYFRACGYLDDAAVMDDRFDETLESAVKSYQEFYHLEVTGKLDKDTVEKMNVPRCGVRDPSWVADYSFLPGKPKWRHTNLTYAFGSLGDGVSIDQLRSACKHAFRGWSRVSRFTFKEVSSIETANIKISFERGNHGDGCPFNETTLAHAFAPTDGRFHYNADQQWSTNPSSTTFDLQTVAMHEIGHLLGLDHSNEKHAIMYASLEPGEKKRIFHEDDEDGIRALYPQRQENKDKRRIKSDRARKFTE